MLDWQCLLRWGLVGIMLFIGQRENYRRPSHRFGGKVMQNTCLSLEPSYIPIRIRRRVLKRDEYKCVWCGKEEKKQVSYFIQKQHGGETSYYDLVTTCEACNRKRHYDTPAEFISKLKFEELDPFKGMTVRVKVIFKNGDVEIGLVDTLPSFTDKGFYLCHEGNGTREPILMSEVHRIKPLGGIEKK